MCGLHVLVCFGDGDVEVEVEAEDGASDEDDEDGEGGVFEVCDLDFHGSEFDPPAYVIVWWWRLEADVLPVCGLEVFEMVGLSEIELLEVFGEDYDGIADEKMSEMSCEDGIHTAIHELLFDIWICHEFRVKILLS